jgi:dihydroorotate dehydrogenase
MYSLLRPLLFAIPPSEAHGMVMDGLRLFEALTPLHARTRAFFAPPGTLRTSRLGLTFPSPVGLAGGFDKDARVPRTMAALGFGFLELGTVTALAQEANPMPNMFRLPDDHALVNRLGFPNDGAAVVAGRFRECGPVGVPVAFSIGKSRAVPIDAIEAVVEDYLASFRAVREVADFVIVNVSSPNTKGLRALQGPALARALLTAVMHENTTKETRRPLLLKVSPDLAEADLDALLDVVRDAKLDGVVATNTTLARTELVSRKDVVVAAGDGGLSGPPLRARALHIVRKARAKLGDDATVIGVGGIETGADAKAFLEAGADLVQLYTGFVYGGPMAPSRIGRELAALT